MRIMDRYLARELAVPFAVGLVGFELMMLGNLLYLYLPLLRQTQVSWGLVLHMLALRAPDVAVYGIPFSALLATAWALSRLARESEITAMRMGGTSIRRILAPTLAVGLAASVLAFLNAEYLAPLATHRAETIVRRMLLQEPLPLFAENTFLRVPPNMYVYVRRVDPGAHRFFDIMVYEITGERYPLVSNAREGYWQGPVLVLRDGVRHKFRADGTFEREEKFQEARVNIGAAMSTLVPQQKTSREMSARELAGYIQAFQRGGLDVRSLRLDYYFKFTLPLAPLICVLLVGPLSLRFSRAGSLSGLLLAFLLTFAYQVLMAWSRSLGESGVLPPLVAAWSQDALFGALGLYLLARQE